MGKGPLGVQRASIHVGTAVLGTEDCRGLSHPRAPSSPTAQHSVTRVEYFSTYRKAATDGSGSCC